MCALFYWRFLLRTPTNYGPAPFLPARRTDTVLTGMLRIAMQCIMPTMSTEPFNSVWNLRRKTLPGAQTSYFSEIAAFRSHYQRWPRQIGFPPPRSDITCLG